MRLAFDSRALARPHSSYARVLSLLRASARAADLAYEDWSGGPCAADVLWSPQLAAPPARGPRLVVTLHDVNPLLPDGRALFLRIRREVVFQRRVRRAMRSAWRVATDSEDSRKRIEAHFPVESGTVRVVPLYADPHMRPGAAAPQALRELGLQPDYVLFVGALRRHKNWEGLMRAFARLPGDLRRRHPLVLAGDARRAGRRLAGLARELGIEADLRALGVVDAEALPHLYRAAALFVFPSYMEGFGLPPLEAMASSVPVVSSDRTSLPEVLGDAALYCDPDDARDMAAAMERVLRDPDLAERMRAAGLRRAGDFTAERTGIAMRRLLGVV